MTAPGKDEDAMGSPEDGLRARLDTLLAERDRATAVVAAVEAVRDGLSIPCLYARVLVPLMNDVGTMWQTGRTTVWEEHFASATVRTIVDALYPEVQRLAPAERERGIAVLACPSQEQHDLGLRMLADRMELAGWRVHFLGADTPVNELVASARAVDADTVVLSVATHYHRVMARAFVDGLRAELPSVRILVGGPAFARDAEGWDTAEIADEAGLVGGGAGC